VTGARSGRSLAASDMLLFRLGGEYFAIDLDAAEAVLELPPLERLPDMAGAMLGVAAMRDGLLPVYTPEAPLRVARAKATGVLVVLRSGERRVGLAVDDVEDVMTIEPSMVRRPPVLDAGDTVLRGVARRGTELVGILDADALVSACAAAASTEAS
jgi:purine-binding chemotaxis protein CheW